MIRRRLQNILCDAWEQSIEQDYQNQRINSEHSLQASFWGQINSRLSNHWMIFVEPDFRLSDDLSSNKSAIKPDIVICNSHQIVCVLELKYHPNKLPGKSKDKDLKTLLAIAKQSGKIHLKNQRYRGKSSTNKNYSMSDNVLYVWAGVYRLNAKQGSLANKICFAEEFAELEGRYLELHAETDHDAHPIIFKKDH